MAYEIKMPQLGLTMEEGTLTQWNINEGDTVKKGDPICVITTDKLTNEVLSEYDGTVLKIMANEGEDYAVMTVLAIIGEADEKIDIKSESKAIGTDSSDVSTKDIGQRETKTGSGDRIISSPYARKTAKELGIDYKKISGSGPNGRVVYRDVMEYVKNPQKITTAKVKASPLSKKIAQDIGVQLENVPARNHGRVLAEDILSYLKSSEKREENTCGTVTTVAMDAMRKAIAKNMLSSHMTSPTVTFNLSVDTSSMREIRNQFKANGIKISYTDIIVKFVAKALQEFPILNCSVDGTNIVYKNFVNIGVAVALDNGLVVPNIQDADIKNLKEISDEIIELAAMAREGKLPMDKMRGGTFTITNLGMYGIESFSPIINQPEVAILGVTTIEDRVVVRDGEIVIKPMMTLSLTADHRVIDGSVAAKFLQRVKTLLENPAIIFV